MPPRINYHSSLGRARAHDIVNSKYSTSCEVDPVTNCWLFTGSLNNDGYGQIYTKKNSDLRRTGRGAQTAFLLHRVAFLANTGTDAPDHVSHLCNRPRCFQVDHLVAETAQQNNSRKGCPGPIQCSDHHHIIVDLCSHQPRCIRGPRDDVICCLTMKENHGPQGPYPSSSSVMSGVVGEGSQSLLSRQSSEYAGAEFLEEAIRRGVDVQDGDIVGNW